MPAEAQLKRKLRRLKQLETAIRFEHRPRQPGQRLVWDAFFSTNPKTQAQVKYPLSRLLTLDREGFKAVCDEYFYRVYFQSYQENGLSLAQVYDPQRLALLGLPPHAGRDDVRRRFRELAKQYHPDHGGDSEKFIELVDAYEKLTQTGA